MAVTMFVLRLSFMLLALASAQRLDLPVTLSLDPNASNLTWLSPNFSSSRSYGRFTLQPMNFQLAGSLNVTVTGCSPYRFNNNVTEATLNGAQLQPSGAVTPPEMGLLSYGVGNVSGIMPFLNISSGQAFSVEQQYGGFGVWWVNPSAVWENVTGFLESGGGFTGGPISNTNLSSTLGAFGSGSGFLTTETQMMPGTAVGTSSLKFFVNSTFMVDPRQLVFSLNASGALLNRVLGANPQRATASLVLTAVGPNPCALFP